MSFYKQLFLMLPSHDARSMADGLAELGYQPDPWAKTSSLRMIQSFGNDGIVEIYFSEEAFIWNADFPDVWHQITAQVGTDQWVEYGLYFTYHPEAETAVLRLVAWMHAYDPSLTVVTPFHHVFGPADLPLPDRAMLYWGDDPWDDDDDHRLFGTTPPVRDGS